MTKCDSLLEELAEQFRSTAVAISYHDFKSHYGYVCASTGYDLKYIRDYAKYYASANVWLRRECDYRPSGRVHVGEQLVPEVELTKTQLYTDWLQPQDLHHRLCIVLFRDQMAAVLLELMRPRSSMPFDQADVEAGRLLAPHLQRLLRVQHRVAELETERDGALNALDYLPWGVLLVDKRGMRLAANRRAKEILLSREGLMLQGNSLRATLAEESARLRRALQVALQGDRDGVGGALSITRPNKIHPLSVVIVPLRSEAADLADRVPAAAIFMSDPDAQHNGNELHLRELYGLTAVEARLATRLSQGKLVEEAAAEMGVSVNTTRAYLKRIYSKIGVRRQSELVRRLLLGLAGLSQ